MSQMDHYLESRLKEIRALHKTQPKTLDDVHFNIAKEASIFVDIIPGYRVQLQSKREKKSKEIETIEKQEGSILQMYEQFLNHLLSLTKKPQIPAKKIAYTCLCQLLNAGAYFNYSTVLIEAVVGGAMHGVLEISEMCGDALRDMFDTDGQGIATLKAVQAASKHIKTRNTQTKKALLRSLLFIRHNLIDIHRQEKKGIRTTVKSGSAEKEGDQFQKLQTQIYQRLLACYLRALEAAASASGYIQCRILEPTLQGLTRISHLLNPDLLNTLLNALKDVLESPHTSPLIACHTVITVLSLIRATQHTMNVAKDIKLPFSTDQQKYQNYLYELIPKLLKPMTVKDLTIEVNKAKAEENKTGHIIINPLSERVRNATVLLHALNHLLLSEQSKVPVPRVLAFTRRISLYTTHQPPRIAEKYVAFLQKLSFKYAEVSELATVKGDEAVGQVAANHITSNPDLANAESSLLWELSLLPRSPFTFLSASGGGAAMKSGSNRLLADEEIHAPLSCWDFTLLAQAPDQKTMNKRDLKKLEVISRKRQRELTKSGTTTTVETPKSEPVGIVKAKESQPKKAVSKSNSSGEPPRKKKKQAANHGH